MTGIHIPLLLSALLCFTSGCSKSDDNEEGALRWECYDSESFGDCECYGVEPGNINVVVSDATEVDLCPMYPKCATYLDGFGDKMCSCGDENFEPWSDSTNIQPADACPPE